MNKYGPLEEYLRKLSEDDVSMTFEEIEGIIGDRLPPCADKHRAWWSNNPSNSSMTRAWLRAGFESAQVDMDRRRLVFRRVGGTQNPTVQGRAAAVADRSGAYAVRGRHPLFGALKGMIRVARGTDLTAPADPAWGATEK